MFQASLSYEQKRFEHHQLRLASNEAVVACWLLMPGSAEWTTDIFVVWTSTELRVQLRDWLLKKFYGSQLAGYARVG